MKVPYVPPSPLWDDDLRLIYVDDPESGERSSFSYPDEILRVNWPETREDGTLIFSATERVPNSESTRSWVWTLNPETGEFQRYDWLCGQLDRLDKGTVLERSWVIIENTDTGHAQLCEVATGRLSAPLPDDMEWPILGSRWGNYLVTVSPDGGWVAFIGSVFNAKDSVYSYEVSADKLRQLGEFWSEDDLWFGSWVGTQVLIYTSEMPEYSTRYIYIADSAKPNTLELAVTRFRYQPEYKDDPPRFDFISGIEGGDGQPHCLWIIYLIETRQKTEHDMGGMCEPEIGPLDGSAYYHELLHYDDPTVNLVRFNPITGERKDLYTGEIESVEWISEDEHYAILTLDDSGKIETRPSKPVYTWGEPANPRLAYVDLDNDEILFEVYAGWKMDWDNDIAEPYSVIRPQEDHSFLALVHEKCCPYEPGYVSRFELVDGEYVETHLVDYFEMDAGGDKMLIRAGGDFSQQFSVYNLKTGEVKPITLDVDRKLYGIYLETSPPNDGSRFNFLAVPGGYSPSDPSHSVMYTIQLP